MAGQFTGMDIPAVRDLAKRLKAKGDEINTITSELTTLLHSTQWVGNDQVQFLGEWDGTHVKALQAVVTGLGDASAKADKNATDQENISNA